MKEIEPTWFLGEEYKSKNVIFVVADNSQNRLAFLNQIGMNPYFVQSRFKVEKLLQAALSPHVLVKTASEENACDVATQLLENNEKYDLILGFHTVAVLNEQIIQKPSTREEALSLLKKLNGRNHSLITGVTLLHSSKEVETFSVETHVKFGQIPEDMFKEYVESDEWIGEFAAYNIYQKGGAFIESNNGCFFNIIGVPIYKIIHLIRKLMFNGEKRKSIAAEREILQKQLDDANKTPKKDVNTTPAADISYVTPHREMHQRPNAAARRMITNSLGTRMPEMQTSVQSHHLQQQHIFVPANNQQRNVQNAAPTPVSSNVNITPREEKFVTPQRIQQSAQVNSYVPPSTSPPHPSIERKIYSFNASPSQASSQYDTTSLSTPSATPAKKESSEVPPSPQVVRDIYSSTYYRATGKPGLYDLRRAGMLPPPAPFDPTHSYKYSDQDDWG